MATQNSSMTQADADCPRLNAVRNAASGALLGSGLVADCLVRFEGENLCAHAEQFDPPVAEAFGVSARFSTGEAFPIYAISPGEIRCAVPGAVTAPRPYILEWTFPQPGPVPCPAIVLKGRIAATDPGLFTRDGSGQGAGLFYTYPDGYPQPIPVGDAGQPTAVQVYGTGMRHAGSLPAAFIDGVAATVVACEADTTRPGYDRLIFQRPGRNFPPGPHRFRVKVDGKSSNEVEIELASAASLHLSAAS